MPFNLLTDNVSVSNSNTQQNHNLRVNEPPKADVKFFTGNSLGNELYSDNKGYTGYSLRFQTKLIDANLPSFGDGKWTVKAMPMVNSDANGKKSEQLRVTTCLPTVSLGNLGKTNFTGRLENRTTLKFDDKFKKTDIAQEPRAVFMAKRGTWEADAVLRAKYSQKESGLKIKDAVFTVQKKLGKVGLYGDAYVPKEALKGDFGKTNYALGVTYNF